MWCGLLVIYFWCSYRYIVYIVIRFFKTLWYLRKGKDKMLSCHNTLKVYTIVNVRAFIDETFTWLYNRWSPKGKIGLVIVLPLHFIVRTFCFMSLLLPKGYVNYSCCLWSYITKIINTKSGYAVTSNITLGILIADVLLHFFQFSSLLKKDCWLPACYSINRILLYRSLFS